MLAERRHIGRGIYLYIWPNHHCATSEQLRNESLSMTGAGRNTHPLSLVPDQTGWGSPAQSADRCTMPLVRVPRKKVPPSWRRICAALRILNELTRRAPVLQYEHKFLGGIRDAPTRVAKTVSNEYPLIID